MTSKTALLKAVQTFFLFLLSFFLCYTFLGNWDSFELLLSEGQLPDLRQLYDNSQLYDKKSLAVGGALALVLAVNNYRKGKRIAK